MKRITKSRRTTPRSSQAVKHVESTEENTLQRTAAALGLDFQALETAGCVKLTNKHREGLVGAVEFLKSKDTDAFPPNKETVRRFNAGIKAGREFNKFLNYYLKLAGIDYRRQAPFMHNDPIKFEVSVKATRRLQDQIQIVSDVLKEQQQGLHGSSGRKRDSFRFLFLCLADKVYRDAGGKGPYYNGIGPYNEDGEVVGMYKGHSLDFFETLLKQVGSPSYGSRGALAQAILTARKTYKAPK